MRVPDIACRKATIKPDRPSDGLFDLIDLADVALALAAAIHSVPH